jgi:hypothetical protein
MLYNLSTTKAEVKGTLCAEYVNTYMTLGKVQKKKWLKTASGKMAPCASRHRPTTQVRYKSISGVARWRNLLLAQRGQDRNRKLAAPLQRREAPWIARLQAASARGFRARTGRAGGFAIPASYAARAGLEAVNALTFEVDPSVVSVACAQALPPRPKV